MNENSRPCYLLLEMKKHRNHYAYFSAILDLWCWQDSTLDANHVRADVEIELLDVGVIIELCPLDLEKQHEKGGLFVNA